MKKLIFLAVLLIGSCGPHWHNTAEAGWNLNFWGSNDKQHKHHKSGSTDPVSVPEPTTILLLGGGMAALAVWRKLRGQK